MNVLTRIPLRTTRDTTQRILGGGDLIKGALNNVINGLKNIPKKALRNWAKAVQDIKEKKLFDNARSAKLQNTLERIPRRTLKEAAERLKGLIFASPQVKASIKNIDNLLKRKPKEAFNLWKNYVAAVNKKELLDNVKSQKLQTALNRVTRRKLRDATERITGEGDKVKGAIKKVYSTLQRKPKAAFEKWKKYLEGLKHKDFFDGLRSAKLVNVLTKIPLRTTRDTTQRILGGGDLIKGALNNVINGLKNIPKKALRNWAKAVQDIKEKKLFDNARSAKLLNSLEKIPKRTLKEATERLKGLIFASPQVKASIKNIDNILKRKPKEAYDKWRKYVTAVNKKEILDNIKSQKLKIALEKVPKRTLRDATQRILGNGDKVKGAIKKVYSTLLRKPKTAFEKWKKYLENLKHKDFFDGLRSAKLLNVLTRIPLRTIRDTSQRIIGGGDIIKGALNNVINGLKNIPKKALRNWAKAVQDIKEKKLFDNARSAKLLNSLEKIPKRTLKESVERIKGLIFASPHVKATIKRMDGILKRKPKEAFDKWRNYVAAVNKKELLDNVKSQKLQTALNKVTRRKLRDATERITGEGDKVKGAIKKVYSTLLRKPKTAFDKWKKYLEGLKHKDFFDGLRSAKLLNALTRIPLRTTRDTTQRILGGGDIIKGALNNLINGLKNIPKKALRNWAKAVQDIKDKKLFDNTRSAKLQNALEKVPRRTLKEAAERLKGIIFASPQVKASIKAMDNILKRKPKEAYDRWKNYVTAVNNKELLDSLKSQKLKTALERTTKRKLRDATQRIVGEGDKVKGAIKKVFSTLQRKPKTAFDKWKKYLEGLKHKDFFDGLRSAKLLNVLTKIPLRTTKDAAQRILGDGNKVKGAVKNIVNGLKNVPKKALRNWNKTTQEIKEKKLFDNARSAKLLNSLEKIPRRTLKEAAERIKGLIFASPQVKASIKTMDNILKRKPKEAFDRWRNYVAAVNKKEILDNVKSQKLKIALDKVPKRTLRDATQRIIGEGDKVKGAIKKVYSTLLRKPKVAFDKWKKYLERLKHKDFFDGLRSAKLLNVLTRIPLRTTRDTTQRILGGGDIIKGALNNVINGLKNIPKKALRNWAKAVQDIKEKKLFDNARSAKLLNSLEKIPKRTLKEAAERLKGIIFASPQVKASIKNIDNILKRKPKEAYDKWKKYVTAVNNKELLDNIKSQKLQTALNRVTRRKLRDATERITGEGDKVKGAIKKVYSTLLRKPKTAFDKWKKYLEGLKHKDFFDGLRSAKLLNALTRIPLRTTRDTTQRILGGGDIIKGALNNLINGLKNIPKKALRNWAKAVQDIKDKKLFDNTRSAKLQNALEKVPRRTLKEAAERIKGLIFASPQIKASIKAMDNILKRKPKEAYDKWKKYVTAVNNKELLDNIKSQKLQTALNRVTRRKLRDATERITGEGDKVKGAIKKVYSTLLRKPKTAFDKWKKYLEGLKHKDFFDGLRSAKLLNVLTRIPLRTTRDTTQRILGGGDLIKGALNNVINGLKNIPKKALRNWAKAVQDIKEKKLFDNARSAKLQNALEKIPRRTLKEAAERIKGIIFASPQIKASIKNIDNLLKRKPKDAFNIWKSYIVAVNKKELLDNVKSQKLQTALNRVTRRKLRDATERITGEGDKVKGAIKKVYSTLLRKPKTAFDKWKKYLEGLKHKDFFDGLRSAKLLNALTRIPIRTTRDTTQRILGGGDIIKGAVKNLVEGLKNIPKRALRSWAKAVQDIKDKKLFDNTRSAKLQNALEKVPRRTLKEAAERLKGIIFASPQVKASIKAMDNILKRKPKEAYDKWRKYVTAVNKKELLDNVKSQKLQTVLEKVTKRKLRDATQRIVGEGNKVKGAIKKIYSTLQRKPKSAFEKWKKYLEGLKHKNFFDNLRSAKLLNVLTRIPLRTTRDASQRIQGDGDLIKGALNNVINGLKNIPKKALRNWAKAVQDIKQKKLVDNTKALKLKISLEKLPKRTLRSAAQRISGEGDKVKGAISKLFTSAQKLPKLAFNKWKNYLQSIKNKEFFDNLRSIKLLNSLSKIPTRVTRDASQRILGNGLKVKGALINLINGLKNIPKKALKTWQRSVQDIKEKKLYDNSRSLRLQIVLERINRKTIKDACDRIKGILFLAPQVKGAVKQINGILKNRPKQAFVAWKKYVAAVNNKEIFDSLRSSKLLNSLEKVAKRQLRSSSQRIVGEGDKVKGAIKTVYNTLNKLPKNAINQWKAYIQGLKNKNYFDSLRSAKLLNALNRIPSRVTRDASQRIQGAGNKVKGALSKLINSLKQTPKKALKNWKDYTTQCKQNKILDNIKSLKLQSSMEKIVKRTLKSAAERTLGKSLEKSIIKDGFRSIETALKRRPKDAFVKWTKYVTSIKDKTLLDGIRTQRLLITLNKIPTRSARDAYQRIIGDGNKIKGALKNVINAFEKLSRRSLEQWKQFVLLCNNKTIYDNLRSEKLKFTFFKVSLRTSKDTFERIVGEGSKVKGALRRLLLAGQKIPKESFER